jgi:hypothetical protein
LRPMPRGETREVNACLRMYVSKPFWTMDTKMYDVWFFLATYLASKFEVSLTLCLSISLLSRVEKKKKRKKDWLDFWLELKFCMWLGRSRCIQKATSSIWQSRESHETIVKPVEAGLEIVTCTQANTWVSSILIEHQFSSRVQETGNLRKWTQKSVHQH